MRKLLFIFFTVLAVNSKAQTSLVSTDSNGFIIASASVPKYMYDSVINRQRSAEYKLRRVRGYVNICLKKPSQKVFLLGWVHRAIR